MKDADICINSLKKHHALPKINYIKSNEFIEENFTKIETREYP